MVTRICTAALAALLSLTAATRAARELSGEEIRKAYYDSYALEKAQNYAGAIGALNAVREAYGKGYTINFRTGWLSYLNGNHADALRFYRRALAVYPASVEVMHCVSLVHKARGDWGKVEEQNYQIVKIDYFNQSGNYWYAVALRMRKKYDLAEKVCRKMLTVFPTSALFLGELGENLYYRKQLREAREALESAQILDPQNESARKLLPLIDGQK